MDTLEREKSDLTGKLEDLSTQLLASQDHALKSTHEQHDYEILALKTELQTQRAHSDALQGKLEAASQANLQKTQLIEQMRGEGKRMAQEGQMRVDQMQ